MNTVRANITSSRYAETNSIFQYDTGRKLEIYGCNLPKSVEVQFSTDKEKGNTITRVGSTNNGVTSTIIPNQLLNDSEKTSNFYIFAFLYNVDNDGGRTEYVIKIPVVARPKPENPSEEPLPEPNIFHETVVAVNASAARAEKAASDAEDIRDNLNIDLSEKITRPDTAEVGQVLAVKKINEDGKPSVFEAVDVKVPTKTSELENDRGFLTEHQDISGKLDKEKLPEAIDDALAQAKESGEFDGKDGAPGEKGDPGETTYIENPYDDTELKSEIATKITAPENPEVGKVFKIKSVNDDGTFIGEWADGANLDVQIDGESIVSDGVAEIPKAKNNGTYGVIKLTGAFAGITIDGKGNLKLQPAYNKYFDTRFDCGAPITVGNLDYAVKSAMTDGKGAVWTAEEQAAARERMDAEQGSYRLIADMVLEEDTSSIVIDKDLNGEPLSLKTARVIVQHPVPRESGKTNGYVLINNTGVYYGAVDLKASNQVTVTMVDVYVYGENAPAFATFPPAVPIQIAQTRNSAVSYGNVVQYFEKINVITVLANYYIDKGARIIILGKE